MITHDYDGDDAESRAAIRAFRERNTLAILSENGKPERVIPLTEAMHFPDMELPSLFDTKSQLEAKVIAHKKAHMPPLCITKNCLYDAAEDEEYCAIHMIEY